MKQRKLFRETHAATLIVKMASLASVAKQKCMYDFTKLGTLVKA